jgi:sodium transport system permease protein
MVAGKGRIRDLSARRRWRRGWSGALRVLRKELLEARRDRNLVLQLVVVPLLLYPLLGFAGIQISMVARGAAERVETVVLVDADAPYEVRARLDSLSGYQVLVTPEELDPAGAPGTAADFRQARRDWILTERPPSARLAWWHGADSPTDSAAVFYDRSRERSDRARSDLMAVLDDVLDSLIHTEAVELGLAEVDLEPVVSRVEDTSSARDRGRWILSMVLPIFLMLMLPQGAFYATLDTIVGERERGTFETILTSPLDRQEILLGKFFYVVLWSVVAFLLNLAGLLIFVHFALGLMNLPGGLELSLAPGQIAVATMAMVLLAVILGAVMMVLAAPASSYREGQALLMPAYLVAAFSGMFVSFAGDEFAVRQALIPVVNVAALLKTTFRGEIPFVPTLITFVELVALGAVGIAVAARLARTETLFFDDNLNLRRLFRLAGRSR